MDEFGVADIFEWLFQIGPTLLQNVITPEALGVQLFTILQTCTDASECQDGNPCDGFEVCEFEDSPSGAFVCQEGAPVTCTGVSAKKLIVVDKLTKAGKAKTVYVASDGAVTKGAGEDTTTISARFDVVYDSASGAFVVPAGPNWKVNKATVAKYVNKDAPAGETEAKVVVVKPGKLLKLVGKGIGDEPLDLLANGAPSGSVFTAFLVDNAGEQNDHCTEFQSCTFKEIAAGSGRKLVCKNGIPDPTCTGG
jgi:hypothetical protein